MLFEDFGLAAGLLRAIRDEGYSQPTPIQEQAITPILSGRDVIGCAQTGTGKTAAFALPLLHVLGERQAESRQPRSIQVLVLASTRELAQQIAENFTTYGVHTGLKVGAIFGGVNQNTQVRVLRKGVEILVATPGRLLDLCEQGFVRLDTLRTLVLDEADRMLDMGFLPAIKQILRLVPSQRQTLLFSATMPPAILALAQSIMRQPLRISIEPERPTAELVEQFVRHVPRAEKADVLIRLLVDLNADRTLVFSRTKHGADRIVRQLGKAGILADAIHSNKSQNRRQRILADFKLARTTVLVATDIAARGIDVDGISHVVNFDMPEEPETYVHRIGRSGRAGATGVAISLCDPEERKWLRDIERLIGRRIAVQTDHAATGSDAMTPRRNERASAVAPAAKRHDIARVSIEHLDRDGEPLAATTAVAAPARFRPAHKWRPAKSFRRFGSKPAGNRRRKSARI